MPNPFAYGACVTDPSRFVGRTNELRRIFEALDTAHTGQLQSVSVVGSRRIGKSSLLYHLRQTFKQKLAQPERYVFAYVDLEAGRYSDLNSLLKNILSDLCEALPSSANGLQDHLKNAASQAQISLGDFEGGVQKFHAFNLYPILCLDEFEQLSKHPDKFPDLLYDSWRSLMNGSYLALVIASARPLPTLAQSQSLTSPFFNIFSDSVELGELTASEAYELISWGKTCDKPFTENECEWAIKKTAHHPYKIQLAGSLIYNAKPNVDWGEVEKQFEAQWHKVEPRSKGLIEWINDLIRALGGAVNVLLNRPINDPKVNWILGASIIMLVIVLIVALLIGSAPLLYQIYLVFFPKK